MIQDTPYIVYAIEMTKTSNPRISIQKNPRTSTVVNNVREIGWACSMNTY
jgi:hypothetical protein